MGCEGHTGRGASRGLLYPMVLEQPGGAVPGAALSLSSHELPGCFSFSRQCHGFRAPSCNLWKHHPLDSKLLCLVGKSRKPGVLNSVYFMPAEAMPCVLSTISNQRRLGGFIINHKPFAASSLGVLLFPAKAYLWKRSSTCSYCCHSLHNYKNWRRNLLSVSKSRDLITVLLHFRER